jgi:hypothetical protein
MNYETLCDGLQQKQDLTLTRGALLNILSRAFNDQPECAVFAEPAPEGEECYQTACRT